MLKTTLWLAPVEGLRPEKCRLRRQFQQALCSWNAEIGGGMNVLPSNMNNHGYMGLWTLIRRAFAPWVAAFGNVNGPSGYGYIGLWYTIRAVTRTGLRPSCTWPMIGLTKEKKTILWCFSRINSETNSRNLIKMLPKTTPPTNTDVVCECQLNQFNSFGPSFKKMKCLYFSRETEKDWQNKLIPKGWSTHS